MTRDEKIDIYNWYKRTGNIALVADLFGKSRDTIRSIVNEKRSYYRNRLNQITAMPKVYLRCQDLDDTDSTVESKDTSKLKVSELTAEYLHEYHKTQTKKVGKPKTKRKVTKSVKPTKTVKAKTKTVKAKTKTVKPKATLSKPIKQKTSKKKKVVKETCNV